MRPSSGGDALPPAKPRSRKSSVADPSGAHSGASRNIPTTFFLRREDDLDRSIDQAEEKDHVKQEESTYGVQSLADTLESAFGQQSKQEDVNDKNVAEQKTGQESTPQPRRRPARKTSDTRPASVKSSPGRPHTRQASNQTTSAPLTPLNVNAISSVPPSGMPSTPKSMSLHSLKLSDEESGVDEIASQAITSSGEEEDEDTQLKESVGLPQLVMPSIQMPSRRPFTSKGKAMGKLKVLIAGEAGVGKTSLIRSIVQLCEDIVHVDSLSPSQSGLQSTLSPQSRSRKRKISNPETRKITEIHASTKAYPPWWTDIEDSRTSRRRKSINDSVLERNLCFIDTPGYVQNGSNRDDMNVVVDYVESLLYRDASVGAMDDDELLGVMGGNGGVQVDVVLYMLSPNHDISKDVEFMQRLSSLTNVIPVIAKSDALSQVEILSIKTSILARLQTTSIKPFFFGKAVDDALLAVQGTAMSTSQDSSFVPDSELNQNPFRISTHPYAISTSLGSDTETMDASLLMSPDYVQPLRPSELACLVSEVFDPDSIAWLRHSAAKKFLAWRHRTKLPGDSFILHGLQPEQHQVGASPGSPAGFGAATLNASSTSSAFSSVSPSGVLVPRPNSPFYLSSSSPNSNLQSPFPNSSPSLSHSSPDGLDGPTDFSLARYNNFAQREHHLAEVRLAKWASDLQRSLRNERERYQELQANERAKWLLERVGEEVRGGNILTSSSSTGRADWAVVRHRNGKDNGVGHRYGSIGLDSRDPLGLCDFSDELRKRGFVLVKVLGGMSVLGAVMVAVVKACGLESSLPEGGSLWTWITGVTE